MHLQEVGAHGVVDDQGRHDKALWVVNTEVHHLLEVIWLQPHHIVVHLDVDGVLFHAELIEGIDGGDAVHPLVGLPDEVDFGVLRRQLLEEFDVAVVNGVHPHIVAVKNVSRQHLRKEILHVTSPSRRCIAYNFIASIHDGCSVFAAKVGKRSGK